MGHRSVVIGLWTGGGKILYTNNKMQLSISIVSVA